MDKFTLLLIIILVYLIIKKNIYESFESLIFKDDVTSGKIPNIIWTFWDKEELPGFINQCVKSWKKHNPNYQVNVINKQNLYDYLDKDEADYILNWKHIDNVQKLADIIRLRLLVKYGGIWLDASIVAFKTFNWIHNEEIELENGTKTQADAIVFTDGAPVNPIIHNWFIASVPNGKYVTDWYNELTGVDQYESLDDYREKQENREHIDHNYLLAYVCARKIYNQIGPRHVKLINAVEGPYDYFVKGGLEVICDHKKTFAKLRKDEREQMTAKIESCLFEPFKNI